MRDTRVRCRGCAPAAAALHAAAGREVPRSAEQQQRSEAFYGLSDGWESRLGPALLRYSIRGHNFSQLKQRACITQLSILDSSAHGEHP